MELLAIIKERKLRVGFGVLVCILCVVILAMNIRYKNYINEQIHVKGWSFANTNLSLLDALETYDLENPVNQERIYQLYAKLEADYLELNCAYNALKLWDKKPEGDFYAMMESHLEGINSGLYNVSDLRYVQQAIYSVLEASEVDRLSLSYLIQEKKPTKRLIVGRWDTVLVKLNQIDYQEGYQEVNIPAKLPTLHLLNGDEEMSERQRGRN